MNKLFHVIKNAGLDENKIKGAFFLDTREFLSTHKEILRVLNKNMHLSQESTI